MQDFEIEYYFDALTVNGVVYEGVDGPEGVAVDTSSSITFTSDASVAYDAPYICLTQS